MDPIWPQIAGIVVAVVAVFGGIVGMTKWVVKESRSAASELYGRLKETEFKNLKNGIAKVETTLEKQISVVNNGLEKQIEGVKDGWKEEIAVSWWIRTRSRRLGAEAGSRARCWEGTRTATNALRGPESGFQGGFGSSTDAEIAQDRRSRVPEGYE